MIFKPRLFWSHATSHRTDRILTDCCLLCLAFLYAHAFICQTFLMFMFSLYRRLYSDLIVVIVCVFTSRYLLCARLRSCYFWFINKFDNYISIAFGLLFSCDMILGCFHLRNDAYKWFKWLTYKISILVNVELWKVEVNNIIRMVRQEYEEYLKLWIYTELQQFHSISMNAYNYQKIYVGFDSIHLLEYPFLISKTQAF